MLRRDRPRLQYNPLFRDSSSNYPFEDIFLYDADKRSNSKDEKDVKDISNGKDYLLSYFIAILTEKILLIRYKRYY